MLLAMMIIATGQVGVSIYLPSLPLISRDLQVDQASAQMLVTLFYWVLVAHSYFMAHCPMP